MEYIEAGEYESQIQGKIDFDKPYIPEPDMAEFYYRVMKRVNAVLRVMSMFLISGSKIPLEDYKLRGLLDIYLEDEDRTFYENESNASLIYDVQKQRFCVISEDDEVIIEEVDIDIAMDIYNRLLVKQEQNELYKKAIDDVQKDKKEPQPEERE